MSVAEENIDSIGFELFDVVLSVSAQLAAYVVIRMVEKVGRRKVSIRSTTNEGGAAITCIERAIRTLRDLSLLRACRCGHIRER